MGQTIPSCRLLIIIEKLEWKQFRKYLCRKDKNIFNNKLFSIPKLYSHSLSNLTNPLIIQSIFRVMLFHNKMIIHLKIKDYMERKEQDGLIQESFKDDNCQQIIDNWKKFANCLN